VTVDDPCYMIPSLTDEHSFSDIDEARAYYRRVRDGEDLPETITLTVHDRVSNITHLPDEDTLLESILYRAEDAEVDGQWHEQLAEVLKDAEVKVAAHDLLILVASKVKRFMADSAHGEITVTL